MYLKEETKQNIAYVVGLPFDQIKNLSLEAEIAHVEKYTGQKLRFPATAPLVSTGDPLLSLGRYRTMEDVDTYFDKMFPVQSRWLKFKAKFKRRR